MKNSSFQEILQAINEARCIHILPHKKPDGDALGSCKAMKCALQSLNKEVAVISDDSIPDNLQFAFSNLLDATEASPDLYVILDSADASRVEGRYHTDIKSILIDHHATNTRFGTLNYVFENASSTGEIVYLLFQEWGIKLTTEILESLYIAIATDTNRFYYDSTSPLTFQIAKEMCEHGVEMAKLNFLLFGENTIEKTRLQSYALMNATITGTLIHISIDHAIQEQFGTTDTDDIVEALRDISGIEVSILFYEHQNQWKASLRSKSKVDVSKVAISFGGGGHKRASGITYHGDNPHKFKQDIITALQKAIKYGQS